MANQRNQMSRIYRGTLKMESHEPSCGIIPNNQNHAENTLFQWGPPIFQKISGDKVSLQTGWKTFKLIGWGKPCEAHLAGALGQSVFTGVGVGHKVGVL